MDNGTGSYASYNKGFVHHRCHNLNDRSYITCQLDGNTDQRNTLTVCHYVCSICNVQGHSS